MSTLVLKGLSEELHRDLKARAKEHGRSLNKEAIGILEKEVKGYRVPFAEPLRLKKPLSIEEVLAAIESGRR